MCIHEWVLFCRRIISSDYTYLEYQNIELFLSFTKIPFERIYFADNWPHRIWGHSRSPIILILLKPVIQYESYFKMHIPGATFARISNNGFPIPKTPLSIIGFIFSLNQSPPSSWPIADKYFILRRLNSTHYSRTDYSSKKEKIEGN